MLRRGKSQVHRLSHSASAHVAVPTDSPHASPRASVAGGASNKLQLDHEEHVPQHPRTLELVRVSGGGAARLQRLSQSGWSSDREHHGNGLTNGYHAAEPTGEHADRCARLLCRDLWCL